MDPRPPPKSPSTGRTLLLSLLTGVVALGLVVLPEGLARLAGFEPPRKPYYRYVWELHPERGYACRPDAEFSFLGPGGWISGTTDERGFRPVLSGAEAADAPAILCLGDSTTFSAEVPDGQTWPEAASRYFAEAGAVRRMLNRAVAGYGTLQAERTLREVLETEDVERLEAVVYLFTINDPFDNLDDGEFPRPVLVPDGAGSFRVRPPELPPEWPPPPPNLKKRIRGLLNEYLALTAVHRLLTRDTSDEEYRRSGRKTFELGLELFDRFAAEEEVRNGFRYALGELAATAAGAGLPLFVAANPYPAFDGDPQAEQDIAGFLDIPVPELRQRARAYHAACETIRAWTVELGGIYIDLRGTLDGLSFREYAASSDDWHYSAVALERIGRAIARALSGSLDGTGPTGSAPRLR